LVKEAERLASMAPLNCLTLDHLEWRDITGDRVAICGGEGKYGSSFGSLRSNAIRANRVKRDEPNVPNELTN
jgi:hypothetical protein